MIFVFPCFVPHTIKIVFPAFTKQKNNNKKEKKNSPQHIKYLHTSYIWLGGLRALKKKLSYTLNHLIGSLFQRRIAILQRRIVN